MSSIPTKELRKVRSAASLHRNSHVNPHNQVEFSNEPYITNRGFAVFTPTMESIENLYKSNSFQPQRHLLSPNAAGFQAQLPPAHNHNFQTVIEENPEIHYEIRS